MRFDLKLVDKDGNMKLSWMRCGRSYGNEKGKLHLTEVETLKTLMLRRMKYRKKMGIKRRNLPNGEFMKDRVFTIEVEKRASMSDKFNDRHRVKICVSYYADEKDMALKELDRCAAELRAEIEEKDANEG